MLFDRSASVDIFLGPEFHGLGIATRAIRMVLDILIGERGHHRVTIDPATHNRAAIRAYERVGIQRVGILRLAERDSDGRGWHDSLMMELVAAPPTGRPGASATPLIRERPLPR
jgi:aminoglycoside 6'-N-acetyltransferase